MDRVIIIALGVIGGIAGFFLLTAAAYLPFVISDARKNFRDSCDYLLILGGDIIGADTPSPQLFERMKSAAVYLRENPQAIAVPCGGCFRKEQKRSEADIIKSYLVEQGIDEKRILPEEKSTTTFENFSFGLDIIGRHSKKSPGRLRIALLSSSYHMHRAGVIAKISGIDNILRVSAPTPGKAAKRFAREYFVAYELAFKYIRNRLFRLPKAKRINND